MFPEQETFKGMEMFLRELYTFANIERERERENEREREEEKVPFFQSMFPEQETFKGMEMFP